MRVYVAGSYSANNVLDVLKNIGIGEKFCADLFLLGYAPFCPWHDKDFIFSRPMSDFTVEMFYDYSMAWLDVSDVIFVLPNSENSKGVQAEIQRAEELNIPVVYSITELDVIKMQGDRSKNQKLREAK
jgi:hypothetical protein